MQKYPVRMTHRSRLTLPDLLTTCREIFGAAELGEAEVVAHFAALARLGVRPEKKELRVDMTMDPTVAPELQAETVRRYNRFLEAATGYSSKERARRLRKSAAPSGS